MTDKPMSAGSAEDRRSELNDLLCGRCATCKHWGGDGKKVAMILRETEFKENFLSIPDTWADGGECRELLVEMNFCEGFDSNPPEPLRGFRVCFV